jgi:hypothetical protein
VEVTVLGDKVAPIAGNGELIENGVHRTHGFTIGTVDTGGRVNEILLGVVGGIDAVHRADLKASSVFNPNTGLSYHVRHTVPLGERR